MASGEVEAVRKALAESYSGRVQVAKRRDLPQAAFYRPRNRYRAAILLDQLEMDAGPGKVVGLTSRDISTTNGKIKDWGIFGLGRLGGQTCVLSSFRLGTGAMRVRRLELVAIHEVGHTFGLNHCPDKKCLMADAEGKRSTVDGASSFCAACAARLGVEFDPGSRR